MLCSTVIPVGLRQVYVPAPSCCKPELRGGARAAKLCAYSHAPTAEWQKENPSFDEIELNDEYYDSLGISPEELADQLSFQADDVDPEGQDVGIDGPIGAGSSSFLQDQDWDTDVWGPEAVVLAGFKAEECAIIRCTLDAASAISVKVLPCTQDMLYQTVDIVLQEPEVDWSQPRPDHWGLGRDHGSQRVVLFSGLGSSVILSIIELLEEAGLPPLCIAVVEEADAESITGDLFAAAIKAQRGRKSPKQHVWEDPEHVSRHLPNLEELIGSQARDRMQAMQPQQAPADVEVEATLSETQQPDLSDQLTQQMVLQAGTPNEDPVIMSQQAPLDMTQTPPSPLHQAPPDHLLSNSLPLREGSQRQSSNPPELSKHAQSMAAGIEGLRNRRQPTVQQAQHAQSDDPASRHQSAMQQAASAQQAQHAQRATPSPQLDALPVRQASAQMQPAVRSSNEQQSPLQEQQQPHLASAARQQATLQKGTSAAASASPIASGEAQQQVTGLENLLDAIIAGEDTALPTHDKAQISSTHSDLSQPSVLSSSQSSLPPLAKAADQAAPTQQPQPRQDSLQQLQEQLSTEEPAADQAKIGPLQAAADALADSVLARSSAAARKSSHETVNLNPGLPLPQAQDISTSIADLPAMDAAVRSAQAHQGDSTSASMSGTSVPAEDAAATNSLAHQADKTSASTLGSTPKSAAAATAAAPAAPAASTARSSSTEARAADRRWQSAGNNAPRTARYRRPSKLKLGAAAGQRRKLTPSTAREINVRKSTPSREAVPGGLPAMQTSTTRPKQAQQRSVVSEQMTAEEFHKLNALGANVTRPAWAQDGMSGVDPEVDIAAAPAPKAAEGTRTTQSDSRALTRAELQSLAERRGLDFERLLADARSKGVVIESATV